MTDSPETPPALHPLGLVPWKGLRLFSFSHPLSLLCAFGKHATQMSGDYGGVSNGRPWATRSYRCPRCKVSWLVTNEPPFESW